MFLVKFFLVLLYTWSHIIVIPKYVSIQSELRGGGLKELYYGRTGKVRPIATAATCSKTWPPRQMQGSPTGDNLVSQLTYVNVTFRTRESYEFFQIQKKGKYLEIPARDMGAMGSILTVSSNRSA